ncbi:nicotinate-nucleotide adenylyltransferase [Ottowia sp.]|uniref:nicotinate-nucleotide adenylyltransferase n=1 Tax=Ottowia sp. TaxID=1898956 RepID=UPI002CC44DFA|nr:nicotinate-nucleotide adenylyltransferase [Ottowia sp.]HOB65864.1 nicotinate-nucleotide adenylyltransferase [Ottowia sp.]HPZ58466.1 nicotinate-nucleotide adenylyltransferase [Ottowia sp.]HQD49399.1 nicotinate-nucleotide adenylyltransferase [Ottowia sp.]
MNAHLQRIGLFGGAFDPPHDAHVALARAAVNELRLDRLHVVPTGDAWHKTRPLSPGVHRLAMCRLAFADVERVRVDDRELRRDGATYTIDTLTELRAEYPGAELFLQIGADQAQAFHTWRRADEILKIATLSIATRAYSAAASDGFSLQDPLPGLAMDGARIRLLSLPAQAHSATEVRRRVAAGLPIDHLVPPAVAGYIAEHHLYQEPR